MLNWNMLILWCYVMRRDERNVLRKALTFKIDGLRKKGRPKVEWTNKIVSEVSEVGLQEEHVLDRKNLRLRMYKTARNVL